MRGFENLGNTCYINAVTQCLFHSAPFRHDLERLAHGASHSSDRLLALWTVYRDVDATEHGVSPPLVEWVNYLQQYAGFPGGSQQDAAECLMYILQGVDAGEMQRRVCGAYAIASIENMVLCEIIDEAKVSQHAVPVSMAGLLVSSLTGDQGIAEAARAIVARCENIYTQGDAYFAVDARVAWDFDTVELTVLGAPGRLPRYRVAAYVAHVHSTDADARARMRSGHYIAYVCNHGCWYELNDNSVVALAAPPSRFPYLVFLVRTDDGRRMLRGKQAVPGTSDVVMRRLLQLRAERQAMALRAASSSAPKRRRLDQDRPGRTQDRAGRDQSGRDRFGRDQSGRDRSGRDQSGRHQIQDRDQSGPDPRVDRVWRNASQGDNRDHTRSDAYNNLDDPYQRWKDAWALRRTAPEVSLKQWATTAEPSLPQPCLLCPDTEFVMREDLMQHVNEVHGGWQRYRNAYFCLAALQPHVVRGQEVRATVANASEFYARSALDWEEPTPEMHRLLTSGAALSPDARWSPRARRACVFCARLMWREELREEYIAGPWCFMESPRQVAQLLKWETYKVAWDDIPEKELVASCVKLRIGATDEYQKVLLHKRRVSDRQADGSDTVFVCTDCYAAFRPKKPKLCRFALANHLWLGRWDPKFRNANLSHQMLLALARVVTTKVVLRPEGHATTKSGSASSWDFLFHQSGMVGSAILFGNAGCKEALTHFPPASIDGSFAVSFVGKLEPQRSTDCPDDALARDGLDAAAQATQAEVKRAVKGIAKLKVCRTEFDEQAELLRATNKVYKEAVYKADLVAKWCPDPATPTVPPIILDNVIAVPLCDGEGGPGRVVADGPGDATAAGEAERMDADVEAAKQARYISAFSPDDIPGASESSASLEVASLKHQLEELDSASARSVAAEVESAIEGGACLPDDAGRERILELCSKVRASVKKLSQPDRLRKLQAELQRAALGQGWQTTAAVEPAPSPAPDSMSRLEVEYARCSLIK